MLSLTAFGKNDIRGIYGEDITEELFYYTGRGFVKYVMNKSGQLPENIWITVYLFMYSKRMIFIILVDIYFYLTYRTTFKIICIIICFKCICYC